MTKAKANLCRIFMVVLPVVLVSVAVALFGVDLRTAQSQITTPKMQDLGTLGGPSSYATGVNDSAKEKTLVVGTSDTSAGDRHAFLYDASATPKMRDLGTLGGSSSYATGVNDSGQVVGYSDTSAGEQHGFLYDSTNGMQDLNDLMPADSGWTITSASAINSDGQIAASGYGNAPPDPNFCAGGNPELPSYAPYGSAFLLTPATTATYEVQDLGTLGSFYSRAAGINNSGQVVGYSYTGPCYGFQHAFLYDENASPQLQDLGTLGIYDSVARGINDFGQVVGQADDPEYWELFGVCGNDACQRAFLYDESATPEMQNLRTLLGDIIPMAVYGSGAWDINNSGQVVGVSASQIRQEAPHGFLYDARAATPKMQDLNTLLPADPGWTITSASAISNDGKIAATGRKDGVGTHALLLDLAGVDTAPSCTKTGTANAETISGTSAVDVICAGGGNDTVNGLGGNDTLRGEGGADTLLGGVGNDALDGGNGTDTASYSASLTAVTASLATDASTGEGSDTFLGVENLLGSPNADYLTGSGTNNKLTGGGGPDTLKGEDGDDTVNSKDGVKGNDSLDGGAGTDTKVTDAREKFIVGFP